MTTPSPSPETTGTPRHERPRNLPNNPAKAMVVIGGCCVVLGGLVAAVTTPLMLDKGSWLAAYLVLVCGVAQFTIGSMQARSGAPYVPAARTWTQLACWNLGNVAVMAGTLTGVALLVDLGATLLLITLGIALVPWRDIGPADRATIEQPVREPAAAVLDWAYRGLLLILLISLPIGVVLAHLRESA